ncbi:hypothetical protein [Vibrio fluvialis]|uniref:hypothetical protein n=1 Tax=Vibrio fluvialis TaxID=676 RepID=UPI001C9BED75|nr:hypothetical protein [Vibrio fluvialis]
MNIDLLNIGFESDIDDEVLNELKESLSLFGNDVEFHEMPPRGVQASIVLYGFSAIAIVFGSAFVKKLGDKAAEDCYPFLKRGLANVYKKYFGESPEIEKVIIVGKNSKQKTPETRYSLVLSLYCSTVLNQRVKFLYAKDWTQEEFDLATEKYIAEIALLVNGKDCEVSQLLLQQRAVAGQYLIAWNEANDKFIAVNILPN